MKRIALLWFSLVLFCLASALPAGAALWPYTGQIEGSISTSDETLIASSPWDEGSSLTWLVTQVENNWFKYEYTFTVPTGSKEISHLIIEVSEGFEIGNIKGWYPVAPLLGFYSPTDGEGNSNPFMPSPIDGLKWEEGVEGYVYSFWITSDRAPMWGDFYAKDGEHVDGPVYAFNSGFGDVTYRYANWYDEIDGKILVPNTVVPVPPSVLLLGTGLVGMALMRFRRRK